jgi:hypothetical protein
VPERAVENAMNAIGFPWFRTGYLATAVCLTIGTSCVLPAPRLMRAVMTVGTDVQLPLERIAIDNRQPAQVTDMPASRHTSASASTSTAR